MMHGSTVATGEAVWVCPGQAREAFCLHFYTQRTVNGLGNTISGIVEQAQCPLDTQCLGFGLGFQDFFLLNGSRPTDSRVIGVDVFLWRPHGAPVPPSPEFAASPDLSLSPTMVCNVALGVCSLCST